MNHATFKASLFMAVGIIDHETGTRDIRRLSGLFRLMPHHRHAGARRDGGDGRRAAAQRLSVEGDVLRRDGVRRRHARRSSGGCRWPRRWRACAASCTRCASRCDVFFGPAAARDMPRVPEEPPRWMRVPVEVLVLACLVVGIAPAPVDRAAARRGGPAGRRRYRCRRTASASGTASTPPLLMSALALAGGIVALPRCTGASERRLAAAAGAPLSALRRRAASSTSPLRRLTALQPRGCAAGLLAAGCSRRLLAMRGRRAGSWARWRCGGGVGVGRPSRCVPLSPAFVALWVIGGVARGRRGVAGEVPPPGGAHARGRRRRGHAASRSSGSRRPTSRSPSSPSRS